MATTQTSPWAGVPYAADVTQADVQPPPAVWAAPAPDLPAPTMPTVTQKPRLDPHAGLPQVFAPVDPQEQIAEHLQSQLQNDYHKDADPYGSPDNHPGFFGKLAHALSHATGGDTRRQWEEQGLTKQINDVRGEQFANADHGAKTAKDTEDTAEMPQKAEDAHTQSQATTGNLESQTYLRDHPAPNLAAGHAYAVDKAIKEGRDPATDPLVLHYEKAIQSTVPGFNKPTEAPKTITAERPGFDGPHEFAWDDKTKAYDIDEGRHYERPMSVNVNAGEAALDRETKQFGAPHQKSIDAANAQLEKIEDARNMVNGDAESQALGLPKVLTALVSGQGSGVRITQPELNAIAKARGLTGDVEGTLNSWSGQGKLTKTQQQQLTGILDDVKARILEKQAIASGALDSINGASSREEIIAADKAAREKINQLERGGSGAPAGADNEVYVGEKLVGHTVGGKYVPLGK